ncbi:U-megalopygitoxin(1)-Mo1-like [Anticarsia gemmatalis]|uniref:U-megalopygitoxin(1)-Mo1-like n=1 Tax=Anticarsia gemmatalis TaxID=129554 RepID=UPI003F770791
MLLRVVVMLWTVVGSLSASKGSSPLQPKPEKFKDVPGCYISDLDKVVPLGKEETSPECVLYTCEEDWFDFYTCDITMGADNCTTGPAPDTTQPYPDCCPISVCSK